MSPLRTSHRWCLRNHHAARQHPNVRTNRISRESTMAKFQKDRIGPLSARVYRIKTEDDVEIAITRLLGDSDDGAREPVVLVHGTFCQRSFWVSGKGIGLAPHLLQHGYDVWIPEIRGHGRSTRDRRYRDWTAEDQMRWDLPAVHTWWPRKRVGTRTGSVTPGVASPLSALLLAVGCRASRCVRRWSSAPTSAKGTVGCNERCPEPPYGVCSPSSDESRRTCFASGRSQSRAVTCSTSIDGKALIDNGSPRTGATTGWSASHRSTPVGLRCGERQERSRDGLPSALRRSG